MQATKNMQTSVDSTRSERKNRCVESQKQNHLFIQSQRVCITEVNTNHVNKTFMQIKHRPRASQVVSDALGAAEVAHWRYFLPQQHFAHTAQFQSWIHWNIQSTQKIRYSVQKSDTLLKTRHRVDFYHTKKSGFTILKSVKLCKYFLQQFLLQINTFLHASVFMFFFLRISKESIKYFK